LLPPARTERPSLTRNNCVRLGCNDRPCQVRQLFRRPGPRVDEEVPALDQVMASELVYDVMTGLFEVYGRKHTKPPYLICHLSMQRYGGKRENRFRKSVRGFIR